MRIGHGYDVHRLVKDRDLILGGIKIPYEKGLAGHSDADVLTHAIMDAILGAIGQGSIGEHFPDTDARFKDISSMDLLRHVVALMRSSGYKIVNLDCTLILEEPKISIYSKEMEANLAQALLIDKHSINIKATTEEKLGFTGRKEAVACHCVCLLKACENRNEFVKM